MKIVILEVSDVKLGPKVFNHYPSTLLKVMKITKIMKIMKTVIFVIISKKHDFDEILMIFDGFFDHF